MVDARTTAGPAETTESAGFQVVGFILEEEEYAIDILEIVGVERPEKVLQLPKMPTFIEGVMRIRDEVVPLIKLRTRFGFDEKAGDDQTRVIVISVEDDQGDEDDETEESTVGYIVDSVTSVYRLDRSVVEDAPAMALTVESRFVNGVVRMGERMIILLNPYEILARDETDQLSRAAVVAEHYVTEAE